MSSAHDEIDAADLTTDSIHSPSHTPLSKSHMVDPGIGSVNPTPLRRITVFCFSLGHVLNDLCASCWFTYLLVLLHKVMEMSPIKAAAVLLSGQIADAIATPLVGIYSDKATGITFRNFYFGRRHLFYTGGTILVFCNFFFLFARCVLCDMTGSDQSQSNDTGVTIYYALAAALFNVGWASVQVSHMSLVPELTSNESQRVVLNSVRYSATVSSNLFVFGVLAVLIYAFHMSQLNQFHILAYICLGVGIATSFVFLIGTEEKRPKKEQAAWEAAQVLKREKEGRLLSGGEQIQVKNSSNLNDGGEVVAYRADESPSEKSPSSSTSSGDESNILDDDDHSIRMERSRNSVSKGQKYGEESVSDTTLVRQLRSLPVRFISYRCWLRQEEYWICGLIYMCTRVAVNSSQVFLPFYMLDVLKFDDVYITIAPCVVYTCSLLAAAYMKKAHGKYGRKMVFVLGFLMIAAGCAGLLFLSTSCPLCYIMFPCIMLIGLGNGTVMVCSTSLTADLIGSRTNFAAFVFGSFSFTDKLITGIVIALLQTFNKDEPTYIRLAVSCPPLIAAVLATLLITCKVDLVTWKHKHTLPSAVTECERAAGVNGRGEKQEREASESYIQGVDISIDHDPSGPHLANSAGGRGKAAGVMNEDFMTAASSSLLAGHEVHSDANITRNIAAYDDEDDPSFDAADATNPVSRQSKLNSVAITQASMMGEGLNFIVE